MKFSAPLVTLLFAATSLAQNYQAAYITVPHRQAIESGKDFNVVVQVPVSDISDPYVHTSNPGRFSTEHCNFGGASLRAHQHEGLRSQPMRFVRRRSTSLWYRRVRRSVRTYPYPWLLWRFSDVCELLLLSLHAEPN